MSFRSIVRTSPFSLSLLLLLALLLGACSSREEETAEKDFSNGPSPEAVVDLPLDVSPTSAKRKSQKHSPPPVPVAAGNAETPPLPAEQSGAVIRWDDLAMPILSDETVTTPTPADGAPTSAKIADAYAISTRNEAIGNSDVATGAVNSRTVLNERIQTQDVRNGQVMDRNIAAGPVTTTEVLNESIRMEDVGNNAVGRGKIVRESIIQDDEYVPGNPWNALTVEGFGRVVYDSMVVAGRELNGQVPEILPDVRQVPEPQPLYENGFRAVAGSPYSTFSIDVDNASYSNVRGYLSRGTLPPADAVRIEELVNYFDYNYPDPTGEHPFAFHSEVVNCPWNRDHLVLRLALQGKRIQPQQALASNLVFLIDVSGSMGDVNKLPLLKKSFARFVDELRPQDQVAVVVYAGAAGLVLASTPGSDKATIKQAINRLESGGSTAGGAGIQLAYKVARDNFLPGGVNRVILATDGDFNVGVRGDDELVALIEEKRKDGVFLSILGFGTGNYQDTKMEKLADNGNGNYYYIDNEREGERVLVDAMSGTLFAIAKDVKLQIKFNPTKVAAYRLIGYENRVLAAKDFDNDAKDAGELGAGHTVTALYEVVPVGADVGFGLDTTKGEEYQLEENRPELLSGNDLLLARLRYKEPTDSVSRLIEHLVEDHPVDPAKAGEATRFAMAVAQWGMVLRGSKYIGSGNLSDLLTQAKGAMSYDPNGYRKEFVGLVERAKSLVDARDAVGTR